MVSTSVQRSTAHVLCTEIMSLLAKGAVETVSPAQSESGFYSHYFLISKKDGGLRPILDRRHLSRALMKRPFNDHIETDPLTSITRGLVLFLLDLKDAYFHIQIAHHHMRFLRFAFERVAYPYTVLPFGLSLAPQTFTKSRDAALCPLRQPGIHILNYLDELLYHRSMLLSHLECKRLRVNFAKIALSPSQ